MLRLIKTTVAALAVLCAGSAVAQDAMTFRFGFATDLDGPGGAAARKMAEVLEERSNGQMKLEIFPSSQLGGEVEMLTQIRSGTLDAGLIGNGPASSLEPSLHVVDLPFIWKSRESFWNALNGQVGQDLLDRMDGKGIKGLGWGTWGTRGLINAGWELNEPDDMRGKKVRVAQSDLYVQTIKAFGGNPVPIAWPEVYTALQHNVVDSIETSYWAFVEAKLFEVASSLAVTDHVIVSAILMMHKPTFDALTEEQQAIVIEAARAGGQAMYEKINAANDAAVKTIEDAGLTVTRPDKAAFQARVQPVYEYFAKEIGADLIQSVRDAQN